MSPADTDEHDRWLREALRHAPDANEAAPPAIAENILRAARTQTLAAPPKPAPALPPRPRLLVWLDALARPQVSGAIASLALATVLGVMWWDMPADVAVPPNESPSGAAHAPADAPVAASASALPDRSLQAEAPRPADTRAVDKKDAMKKGSAPPPVPSSSEALRRERAADLQRDTDSRAARKEAERSETRDAARAQAEAKADWRSRQDARMADEASPPAKPVPAPEPVPAPAAPATESSAASPPLAPVAAAAPPPPAPVVVFGKLDRSTQPSGGAQESAAAPRARARLGGPERSLAGQVSSDLSHITTALLSDPSGWSLQVNGGEPRAVGPALIAWLRTLDATVHNTWTSASPASTGDTLRLLREGHLVHQWTLAGEQVTWTLPQGRKSAPLDEAAAQGLRQAFDALR